MTLKDVAIAGALAVLIPITIFQIPSLIVEPVHDQTIHDLREELDYHKEGKKFLSSVQELEAHQEKTMALTARLQELQEKNKKENTLSQTLSFYVTGILGLFILAVGLTIPVGYYAFAAGCIGGGVITLIFNYLITWQSIPGGMRFGIVAISLAILFFFGQRSKNLKS